jgi:Cft2 family RNA processing exonuclease
MTAGTHAITSLLADVAAGPQGEEQERARPPSDREAVHRLLAQAVTHDYFEPFQPAPHHPDITVRFLPAGHVAGAAALVIDGPTERCVITGDFSIHPTPTAGALSLEVLAALRRERPVDVVISEGTYGTQTHPGLKEERRRLIALLRDLTRRGGRVLIPAFALGRAQDVIAIIRAAKLKGHLTDVPVFLDGLVQPVTELVSDLLHHQYPERGVPLPLLDDALDIRRATSSDRARLLSAKDREPAIVIASSGMLLGGRSVEYARAFAPQRRCGIIISGYQDEESPGRHLLGMKQGGILRVGDGSPVPVRCRYGRYHASAHADGAQIQQALATLAPRAIGLVHGEPSSLEALQQAIGAHATVLENGVWMRVPPMQTAPRQWQIARALAWEPAAPPSDREVTRWWRTLSEQGGGARRAESVAAELLPAESSLLQIRRALGAMAAAEHFFDMRRSKGELYVQPRPPEHAADGMAEQQIAQSLEFPPGSVVVARELGREARVVVPLTREGPLWRVVAAGAESATVPATAMRQLLDVEGESMLRRMPPGRWPGWLDGLAREARMAPPVPLATLWFGMRDAPEGISFDRALAWWVTRLEASTGHAVHLTASQRVQLAAGLANATALFRLVSPDHWGPRDPTWTRSRWGACAAAVHVLESHLAGTAVRLRNGSLVQPTGDVDLTGFWAASPQGEVRRYALSRVDVAQTPTRPARPINPTAGKRRRPRRSRRGRPNEASASHEETSTPTE